MVTGSDVICWQVNSYTLTTENSIYWNFFFLFSSSMKDFVDIECSKWSDFILLTLALLFLGGGVFWRLTTFALETFSLLSLFLWFYLFYFIFVCVCDSVGNQTSFGIHSCGCVRPGGQCWWFRKLSYNSATRSDIDWFVQFVVDDWHYFF